MTPLPPVSVKYARNNNTRVAERVITGLIKARACAFGDANVLSLVACQPLPPPGPRERRHVPLRGLHPHPLNT